MGGKGEEGKGLEWSALFACCRVGTDGVCGLMRTLGKRLLLRAGCLLCQAWVVVMVV